MIPGFGGTQRLARRVGQGMAREMIFTGMRLSAQRAKDIGLVNEVVSRAELMDRVRHVSGQICKRGPVAIAQAKPGNGAFSPSSVTVCANAWTRPNPEVSISSETAGRAS